MPKALVTGGSGFIALYVVKLLVERGCQVNVTVRSVQNNSKLKALLDLQILHPNRLTIYEADLMKSGSFDKAMEGCSIVYHVASPFLVPQQIKDGMQDCVQPALKGTKNVLQSVNKVESVRRVVLTSSIAAIYGDSVDVLQMKDATLTEDYWNETSTSATNPYSYSKMIAEREAWGTQGKQNRWDLVVINPGLVLGPSLSPGSSSGSLFLLESMYRGENRMGSPELYYPIVDVRNVAEAHVRAGIDPSASGRYIIASDQTLSLLDMANLVRPVHNNPKLLPSRNLPKLMVYIVGPFIGLSRKWISGNIGIEFKVDNRRSKKLGVVYGPPEDVVRDHYVSWLNNQKVGT